MGAGPSGSLRSLLPGCDRWPWRAVEVGSDLGRQLAMDAAR